MQFLARPHRRGRIARALRAGVAGALAAVLAACSGGVVLEPAEGPVLEARMIAKAAAIEHDTAAVEEAGPAEIALQSSQVFFESAQVVVLASAAERSAIARAASVAITLGTPLLLTAPPEETPAAVDPTEPASAHAHPGSLNTELLRLGTRALLTVGEVSLHQLDTTSLVVQPVPDDDGELADLLGVDITGVPAPAAADAMRELATLGAGEVYDVGELGPAPDSYGSLPATLPAQRNEDVTVLTGANTRYYAGVATARAAGAQVFTTDEPASLTEVVAYFSTHPTQPVVGIGQEYLDPARLERLVGSLRTGSDLPSGAQSVFRVDGEDVTVVSVDARAAFAESDINDAYDVAEEARARAAEVAEELPGPAVAGIEVDARREADDLHYWLQAATDRDTYLTLIVRPTATIVEALRPYEEFLAHPLVGVRLDARRGDHIDSREINDLAVYLRRVVRDHRLPQKLFVIDLGEDTRVTNPDSLTLLDRELALTFAVDDDAHRRDLLAALGPGGHQALTIARPPAEDDEPTPAPYPGPADIIGAGETDLLTYR